MGPEPMTRMRLMEVSLGMGSVGAEMAKITARRGQGKMADFMPPAPPAGKRWVLFAAVASSIR
ncbi:MAG: hypothetical protein ACOYMN_11005, partial [Roseimicrobium sp.]